MSNMKAITMTGQDTGYADIIIRYFEQAFPNAFKAGKEDLLEIITTILVGTKEIRYGSQPKAESLVKIRATILEALEKNLPIPVLVPWGGTKAVLGQHLDIAEVAGIKQLITVDEILKRYYTPGLLIHIDIEDSGAYWLYRDEAKSALSINKYSDDLVLLVNILKGKSSIFPIRESTLVPQGAYCDRSQEISDLIFDYLTISRAFPAGAQHSDEWKKLEAQGWKGSIPEEQQSFYIDRYRVLKPGADDQVYVRMLADYLGGAKARYDLDMKAQPTILDSYIKISFVPPVPGVPRSLTNNTLYYRTVPLSHARTHIAPWRAKGYLEILDGTDEVRTKITSWSDDVVASQLISAEVSLQNDDGSLKVTVESDHLIKQNINMLMAMSMPMF